MATRLRLWRAAAGLSQKSAAKCIPTSRATYSGVESGRLRPSDAFLVQLQVAFGEPGEALLRPAKAREAIPQLRVISAIELA